VRRKARGVRKKEETKASAKGLGGGSGFREIRVAANAVVLTRAILFYKNSDAWGFIDNSAMCQYRLKGTDYI